MNNWVDPSIPRSLYSAASRTGSGAARPAADAGAWPPPRRRGRGRRSPRRSAHGRRSCDGRPAGGRRRSAGGPTPRCGGRRSARRTGRAARCCGSPAAICRCSRLSKFSYCRQVAASRVCASDCRIAAMSSSVACSAASRAISGSMISRARITSAGLVRPAISEIADRLLDRAAADEGALADMAPDAAVLLEHGERLAQIAARNAEAFAELALRRQPAVARQVQLREIGLKLHQRGVAAVCLASSMRLTNSQIISLICVVNAIGEFGQRPDFRRSARPSKSP